MSARWTVRIPHRSRDESLASAAAHARDLGDDSEWTRTLMLRALRDGDSTVGDLLDCLERIDPGERRQLIDAARAELGLEPTATIDEREQREALQRTRVPAAALVLCAHESCTTAPARFGVPYNPGVRRWHCPNHEHLAQPGDLEPVGSGVRIAPAARSSPPTRPMTPARPPPPSTAASARRATPNAPPKSRPTPSTRPRDANSSSANWR